MVYKKARLFKPFFEPAKIGSSSDLNGGIVKFNVLNCETLIQKREEFDL
jgi:hypothetical protein